MNDDVIPPGMGQLIRLPDGTVRPAADVANAPRSAMGAHILGVQDRKFEDVEVPEWGVTVRVREMDGIARAQYSSHLWEAVNAEKQRIEREGGDAKQAGSTPVLSVTPDLWARVVVATCCDPKTDEPLFGVDDIPAVAKKNGNILQRLWMIGMQLSDLSAESVEAGKADSEPTSNSESGTDSPSVAAAQ